MKRTNCLTRPRHQFAALAVGAIAACHSGALARADELPAGVNATPNAAAAGLWIGTVSLNKVNEVRGDTTKTVPSAGVFQFTILLHVDAAGATRLIKDVVIMKNGADPALDPDTGEVVGTPPTIVLVTDPTKIGDFAGVERRNGKLAGIRYGSPAYDFDGNELALSGGIGAARACTGQIVLSDTHPTNPYRHKYHPEHSKGFNLTRDFCLVFEGTDGDPIAAGPGFGVDRITGTYQETLTGLHKVALKTSGVVTLDRVSDVAVLNQ